MKRKFASLLLAICLMAGCAPALVPFGTPVPGVKIDKFFVVLVTEDKDKPGGCAVNVQPKGPSAADPNDVKVRYKSTVAWLVVNTCAAKVAVTPTIDFYLDKTDPKTKKLPIDFTHVNPDFLIGKVKSKPQDCTDLSEAAPCTTFKYTIHFGNSFEDPDIEIVM